MLNLTNLPSEIKNHHILPFIPCFGLSNSILKLQIRRIQFAKYIEQLLSFDDVRLVKKDILRSYQGGIEYYYEDAHIIFYIELAGDGDYIYLIF